MKRSPTGEHVKILVCIKEVPETDAPIILDETSPWIAADDSHYLRMNRFDEYAVEEAVLIKESFPDVTIDALTIGPRRAEKILRRAVGMGADNAFHIVWEHGGYLSAFAVSSWIAQHAADRDYDLILTGVMSEDNMQGQTGPILAELLSMPCATSVISERLSYESKRIYVEREIECGRRACLEMTLPAVLTIQSGINKPRYPSLSKMLQAKKRTIGVICLKSLQTPEARDEVVALGYPEKSRQGVMLEGSVAQKAAELVRILGEKSLI